MKLLFGVIVERELSLFYSFLLSRIHSVSSP